MQPQPRPQANTALPTRTNESYAATNIPSQSAERESSEFVLNHLQPLAPKTVSHARSYKLLEEARERANKDRGYCSETWRSRVRQEVATRCNGRVPYWYQEDVAEAFHLELDVANIAGTGFGKTLPFVMPLLVDDPASRVIIVSPLNALERDQAARFRDMGLTAAAVNGEDYSSELHKQLEENYFRVIVTSPEMILQHPRFSKLMRSSTWMEKVIGIIVDELTVLHSGVMIFARRSQTWSGLGRIQHANH
ncbi:hypothetical protein BC835DRAFT_1276118 [Cytidiella melzeri]|nr:hypothetical protein BC835DRAFT_1276118 [Cytidiella melzeri]